MKQLYKSLALIAAITLVSACVTAKKKGEAKGVRLFFQNLTAKYNGYFNANVAVEEATLQLAQQHVDDYNKVLDVYPELAVDNAQAAFPNLDKAIEKVAVVATYHRPSHWVDDCYLLMGKAQYLKHDFEASEETFLYLTEMYNPALKGKMTKKQRAQAVAEIKKDKEEDRKTRAKELKKTAKDKKEERDALAKEKKAEKEAETKARAAERDAAADARKDEQKLREKEAKQQQADAQKLRDAETKARSEKSKKKQNDLKSRNEQLKKEMAERTEQRKKEREERAKQAIADKEKVLKDRENRQDKREESAKDKEIQKKFEEQQAYIAAENEKNKAKNADVGKSTYEKKDDPKKQEVVMTGANGTPVLKNEEEENEKNAKPKVAKKPKGSPKNYFLRHRPCYQEGVVWYALALIERENYQDAEVALNDIERNPKTFKDVRTQAAVAKAHLYLKQKQYALAIPALETALQLKPKKKMRARLAYILAQCYQMTNETQKAAIAYDKVLNYRPEYEMEFNSRLNLALNSEGAAEKRTSQLLAMSKDFKNKEFGAQIFYTLSQIAAKNGDKEKAMAYLQQALVANAKTPSLKAEPYFTMAKLQFEAEKFDIAKSYFDSAASAFADKDPRKTAASLYAANLTDIAENIGIINLQDSLIRIAGLTDKEKRALSAKIKKAKQAKAASLNAVAGGGAADIDLNEAAKISRFFAYNTSKIKQEKRDFEKKWGTDRKLEDNWRRSSKRSNGSFAQGGDTEGVSSGLTDKEFEEMMRDVPKTPEDIAAAKDKIDAALHKLGLAYYDRLKNFPKAAETFETHLRRFPENKKELEDWYYLCLIYEDLKQSEKSKIYFDKVQSKYNGSTYAKILKNPNEFKVKDGETLDQYYAKTYAFFKEGKYKEAQDRILAADSKFGSSNIHKAKFELLAAMCLGRLQGKDAYVAALKQFIPQFPNTPEQKRAEEILRVLEVGGPITESPKKEEQTGLDEMVAKFQAGEEKMHYVLIVLPKNMDVEEAKIVISDFNSKYFRTENLNINPITLSPDAAETNVVNIRKFAGKVEAKVYTDGVAKNPKEFVKGAEVFSITQDNYREILRQKSVEAYRIFYDQNYR